MSKKALTEDQVINEYVGDLKFAKDLLKSHVYSPAERVTYIVEKYPALVSISRTHFAVLCGMSREHLSRTMKGDCSG